MIVATVLALWVVQFVVGVKVLACILRPLSDRDRVDIATAAAFGVWILFAILCAIVYATHLLTRRS